MKKLLTVLVVVFFVGQTWAQTTEYLQQKDFKVEKQKIYEGINASKRQLNEIRKGDLKMELSMDSLKKVLGNCMRQMGMANDSLLKTSVKLNALQEKVDNERFLSKGMRILINVILILLLLLLFVLLYLFKKKADLNHQSLVELDKKTNERIDLEMKNLKTDIQNCRDLIVTNANDLNQRISSGISAVETRSNQLEKQLQDDLARIGGKIEIIGPEISKLKEEFSVGIKAVEDKLNVLKRDVEQKNEVLTTQAAKLEEEVRLVKGKH